MTSFLDECDVVRGCGILESGGQGRAVGCGGGEGAWADTVGLSWRQGDDSAVLQTSQCFAGRSVKGADRNPGCLGT